MSPRLDHLRSVQRETAEIRSRQTWAFENEELTPAQRREIVEQSIDEVVWLACAAIGQSKPSWAKQPVPAG